MRTILLVVAGGALGSAARYALAGFVHRFTSPYFPYGTFAVNITGCLLFGIVAGLSEERFAIGPEARTLLLVGILGGFTTFSTFTFETFELIRGGEVVRAVLNSAGQVLAGLLAIWAGFTASRLL
jgi:CrcB protein